MVVSVPEYLMTRPKNRDALQSLQHGVFVPLIIRPEEMKFILNKERTGLDFYEGTLDVGIYIDEQHPGVMQFIIPEDSDEENVFVRCTNKYKINFKDERIILYNSTYERIRTGSLEYKALNTLLQRFNQYGVDC